MNGYISLVFPLQPSYRVPEGGRLLYGLGRDAAYAAAERGDIPCLTFGRSKVIPTLAALQQLGWSDDLIARALGMTPEHSEAGPVATEPATASIHALAKGQESPHGTPPVPAA
jgi:hypothetical protein